MHVHVCRVFQESAVHFFSNDKTARCSLFALMTVKPISLTPMTRGNLSNLLEKGVITKPNLEEFNIFDLKIMRYMYT